jgi:hypothetical protein
VIIRNLGLIAAIELAPRAGATGARGMDAHLKAFEKGTYMRVTGDTIAPRRRSSSEGRDRPALRNGARGAGCLSFCRTTSCGLTTLAAGREPAVEGAAG